MPEYFLKSMLFVSLGFPPEVKAMGGRGRGRIARSKRRSCDSLPASTKAATDHASLNKEFAQSTAAGLNGLLEGANTSKEKVGNSQGEGPCANSCASGP